MERKVEKPLYPADIVRLQFQALINVLEKKGIMSIEEFFEEFDLLELEESLRQQPELLAECSSNEVSNEEKHHYSFEPLNTISIDNRLAIDGVPVKYIKNVEIKSGLNNISEVKIEFLAKIKGLDNL